MNNTDDGYANPYLLQGNCPQCGIKGKSYPLFFNEEGYVECPNCRLTIIRGANGNKLIYILKKRGTGDFLKGAILKPEGWQNKAVCKDLGDIYKEILKEMQQAIKKMRKDGEIDDAQKAEYLEQAKNINRREEVEIRYLLSEGKTHDKADDEVRWLKANGASHLSMSPVLELYNRVTQSLDLEIFVIHSDAELNEYLQVVMGEK